MWSKLLVLMWNSKNGCFMWQLLQPEVFKDIRSCRLTSVYQHILTVAIFRDRRINYSYACTNIYHSTRRDNTEEHESSSHEFRIDLGYFFKVIFSHR
jgi:hypothetical protein